ncbi:MAG: tight adherence protein C [Myxococcota bacterium]|jgi:tight adherence protein C
MDPLNSPYFLGFIAFAILMTMLSFVYAVRLLLNPERTAQDRIADLTGGRNELPGLIESESVQKVTGNLSSLAAPSSEDQQNLVRTWLIQAGFRSRGNLETYSAIRAGLAVCLPLLSIPIMQQAQPIYVLFFVMLLATIGYYVPVVYVNSKMKARKKALLKPFPDAMDLLVSSVEAGLGVDAAFQRVAKEIENAAPVLSRELQMVNHEVAAGIPRIDALRRLDKRTGLQEVNSLVNVLTQADRFGTSIAQSLRVHSELVRTKRMLEAEEQAAAISPKLTVGMIIFILPSLFVVLVGPAVINVIRKLLPAISQ